MRSDRLPSTALSCWCRLRRLGRRTYDLCHQQQSVQLQTNVATESVTHSLAPLAPPTHLCPCSHSLPRTLARTVREDLDSRDSADVVQVLKRVLFVVFLDHRCDVSQHHLSPPPSAPP